MQVSLNTRIDHTLAAWLDEYAKTTGKSKAGIVAEALEALKAKAEKK